MIKMMVLIKAKAGLDRVAFRAHYEELHVPLVRRLHPTLTGYRRNYVETVRTPAGDGCALDFDVITEAHFDNEAAYHEFLTVSARPDVRALILEDERQFVDIAKTRRIVVDMTM